MWGCQELFLFKIENTGLPRQIRCFQLMRQLVVSLRNGRDVPPAVLRGHFVRGTLDTLQSALGFCDYFLEEAVDEALVEGKV